MIYCPIHNKRKMLLIEELNFNTGYYRCEFIGNNNLPRVHTILIINYDDKPMSIKTD